MLLEDFYTTYYIACFLTLCFILCHTERETSLDCNGTYFVYLLENVRTSKTIADSW